MGLLMKKHVRKKTEFNNGVDDSRMPRKKREAGSSFDNSNKKRLPQREGYEGDSDVTGQKKGFDGNSDVRGRKKGFQDNSDQWGRTIGLEYNSDVRGRNKGFEDNSDVRGRKKSFQDSSNQWGRRKSFEDNSDVRGRKKSFQDNSDQWGQRKSFDDNSDQWGRNRSFRDKSDVGGRKKGYEDNSGVVDGNKSFDFDGGHRKKAFHDNSDQWGGKKGFQDKADVGGRRKNFQDMADGMYQRKGFEDKSDVAGRKKGFQENSDQWGQKKGFREKSDVVDGKKGFQDKADVAGRKKSFEDKSEAMDSSRKNKKRVKIRIDPNDISNKRIDDGVSTDGKIVEKKDDPDKDNELSKNAQFRAIQPTSSILSFVEDNLLGRRRLIELRRAGYNIDLSAPLDNIPSSTSSERERIEETVFRNKLTFFAAAKVASSFPPPDFPEIAFAGRSNVGKSSLLNALTRQWGVVRTSDKPGLTQTINFFKLGPKLCMVDLPGYGFAYAKEEVKDAWEELVKEYVSTRVGLKRVCLLIDTKWGMKPRDHELIDLMERYQTKYQIVMTKTDTVFPMDVARRAMQIEETLKANKSVVQPVMMVSSKSGAGIRSLRTVLGKVMRFAKV